MRQQCLTLSLWLLAGIAFAQAPTKPFLIGAEWREDASPAVKELFWETGCNFARLTGGGYGWAVDSHKRALVELDKHGVRVLLQLGSHYPDSRFFEFKDDYFIDQNGQTGVPSKQSWAVEYDGQSWPQYSYASTHFRAELEKEFTAYFKALGPLKNVDAVLLHNEPGLFWLDKRVFDYNPASIAFFRNWLPTQYKTIAELNQAWGVSFRSFAKVEPPRDSKNLAAWMDWRRSNDLVIGDFLRWERDFAHRAQPGVPATTNLSGPIDNWFPLRLGDNYRFTQGMDIATIDIYPGSEWTTRFFPGFAMDMTRGAANGKPVYVGECESYSASRFPKLNDEQRADRLRSDLWSYIGHGANAISVWTLNGQDEFRLTNGEFNARIRALRETAYAAKMLNLGEFSKPARKVALVVDQDSYLLDLNGESPRDWAGEIDKTAQGIYAALAQAHFEVDVISADMVRAGAGGRYRALVLASPEAMDAALAQRLTKFVQAGGLLIADSTLAQCDRWGKAFQTAPSFGLDRLFGVQVKITNAKGYFPIKVGETSFHGLGRSKLTMQDSEPLGRFPDGETAVTVRKYGNGHAILVGANFGAPNSEGGERGLSEPVEAWLKKYADVSPGCGVFSNSGYLDATQLRDPKGNVLEILTNPSNKAEAVTPSERVFAGMDGTGYGYQSFVFQPAARSNGRISTGPKQMSGGRQIITNMTSYAAILNARDHEPLLATDSPQSLESDSKIAVKTTVFNPSPNIVEGKLQLELPSGWRGVAPSSVKIAPFGHSTYSLQATTGSPAKRAVLKAVLVSNSFHIESIPFDVAVNAR